MVQRPQLNVLEKVQSKDATEEAPAEDPPTWDEVEADIDNWYDKMAQKELDEESGSGGGEIRNRIQLAHLEQICEKPT